MKLTIDDEHREFFRENHRIEFEEFLTVEEILYLKQTLRDILAERLHISSEKVLKLPAPKLFEMGRDLWRDSEDVKEISCRRAFGEVASLLTGTKPLRLGYDQFFPAVKPSAYPLKDPYDQWLRTDPNLQDAGSFQGVVCGVLLTLTQEDPIRNVTFLGPEALLELNVGEHAYYMIVYTAANSVYLCNKQDPHGHELLRRGYFYGDRLSDKWNPIAFR